MILGIDTLQEIALTSIIAIPIINGLVNIFAIKTLNIPKRYLPATSVAFGVLVGLLVIGVSWVGVAGGALIGMASTGLYEFGVRSVAGAVKDVTQPNE